MSTSLPCLAYINVPSTQLHRLQQIQKNSLACAVVKAPKFTHTTPILKSLHWLKVNERIEYKILSLVYTILNTSQPAYLYNLISLQSPRCTHSSSLVTLAWPPSHSTLKITDRSFWYASPHFCSQLAGSFRQPCCHLSIPDSSHLHNHISSPPSSTLSPTIRPSLFCSLLKTFLFSQIFSSIDHRHLLDCSTG